MGKTTLTRQATQKSELNVAWAGAWAEGGAPALWPWTQLLRQVLAAARDDAQREAWLGGERAVLALLDPRLGTPAELGPFALREAACAFFERAARDGDWVLVLDDIHAADLSTLDLLLHFGRTVRSGGVCVICTRRTVDEGASEEAQQRLGRLCQESEELALGELAAREVRALAEQLAGEGLSDEVLEALQRRAGGVPLFVEGLLHAATASGAPRSLDEVALPGSLRAVLYDRVKRLGEARLGLLRHVALVRGGISTHLLARATGQALDVVQSHCEAAVREGVLCSDEEGLRFSHQVFGEIVAERMSPEARQEVHLSLGEAMRRLPGEGTLAALGRHLLAAGRAEGVEYALEGARSAAKQRAYASAAELYELASTGTEDPAELIDIAVQRADALRRAGSPGSARDVLEGAWALAQERDLVDRLPTLALAVVDCVGFAIADEESQRWIAYAVERTDAAHPRRASLLAAAAQARWVEYDFETAEQVLDEALGLRGGAAIVDQRRVLVAALQVHWRPDRLADRLKWVEELAALPSNDPADRLEAARWEHNIALERCDGATATRAVDDYARAADALREPQSLMNSVLRRATMAQIRGDWDEAERLAPQIGALGRKAGDPQAPYFEVAVLVLGAIERGRPVASPERVKEEVARWSMFPGIGLEGAWVAFHTGERERAVALYEEHRARGFQMRLVWGHVHGLAVLARLSMELEDREGAELLLPALREYQDRFAGAGPLVPFGPLAVDLARLEAWLGEAAAAAKTRRRARQLCEQLGARWLLDKGAEPTPTRRVMRRDGDSWVIDFDGETARLRSSKGLEHIVTVLSAAEPVHVLDLMSGERRREVDGDAGPVLDDDAKDAYRRRAEDLMETIREAEANGDPHRASVAQAELDLLTDELSKAVGLGGRDRRVASAAERARSAVKQAIRRAVKAIAAVHPAAGAHLDESLDTGMTCGYRAAGQPLEIENTKSPNV
jgi:hypothetical protein